jgi:hypothetical protein
MQFNVVGNSPVMQNGTYAAHALVGLAFIEIENCYSYLPFFRKLHLQI